MHGLRFLRLARQSTPCSKTTPPFRLKVAVVTAHGGLGEQMATWLGSCGHPGKALSLPLETLERIMLTKSKEKVVIGITAARSGI